MNERIQETVSMFDATIKSTWDKLSKEELRLVIDGYIEMLKQDCELTKN